MKKWAIRKVKVTPCYTANKERAGIKIKGSPTPKFMFVPRGCDFNGRVTAC